jgi:hypothetical protein
MRNTRDAASAAACGGIYARPVQSSDTCHGREVRIPYTSDESGAYQPRPSTVEGQKLAVCDILSTVWDSKWKSVLGRQDWEARDENASVANNGCVVAGYKYWSGRASIRDAVACGSAHIKSGAEIILSPGGRSLHHSCSRRRPSGSEVAAGARAACGRTSRRGLGLRDEP